MNDEKLDEKTLRRAKAQAQSTLAAVLVYCQTNSWKITWEKIESHFGIQIPEIFKRQRCDYAGVKYGWGSWYVNNVEKRLAEELSGESKQSAGVLRIYELPKERTRWKSADGSDSYLAPEQDAVYLALVRDFFHKNPPLRAAYNDGIMGSGKTVLGVALIKYIIENDLIKKSGWPYAYAPILIITPNTVMEVWARHCEMAGLGKYLGNTIVITSYSAMTSSAGRIFYKEEYHDEQKTRYKWNVACLPYFVILDEAHKLNRDSKQTKVLISLFELDVPQAPVRSLWLSATPWVTVSNTKAFAIATKSTLLGMRVTAGNFNQWARLITAEPDKPSITAAAQIRKVFSPYIYSFPRVKWPHKAINSTMLVEFSNEHDIEIYRTAYERFLAKCRKLGRSTNFGQFERGVALMQFRIACEPLRIDAIVDACDAYIKAGTHAPVIGCAFRPTVIRAVFRLIDKGYKREDISVIWGGKDDIKKQLVLSEEEIRELIMKTARGEQLTKHELRRMQETIIFREDQLLYNERLPNEDRAVSDARTFARHEILRQFGLMGTQSENKRQIEIDRFQNGESKICIFTLAAGGVGLSLDHNDPKLLPRIGFFTPTYSGIEFRQALGRLVRRFTLSDTWQYIVGLRGTVEETHVLPLIERKLKCLAKVTNSDYDIMNALINDEDDILSKSALGRLRSQEEAMQDAENEDTQLHIYGDEKEEEEEENEVPIA